MMMVVVRNELRWVVNDVFISNSNFLELIKSFRGGVRGKPSESLSSKDLEYHLSSLHIAL
jgi:hypothetical protein